MIVTFSSLKRIVHFCGRNLVEGICTKSGQPNLEM